MEPIDTLTALSPLDGRYANKLDALRPVFSEAGLIRRRVAVEVAWLEALCDARTIPDSVRFPPNSLTA
jgi:adenylosuccinate lyase